MRRQTPGAIAVKTSCAVFVVRVRALLVSLRGVPLSTSFVTKQENDFLQDAVGFRRAAGPCAHGGTGHGARRVVDSG